MTRRIHVLPYPDLSGRSPVMIHGEVGKVDVTHELREIVAELREIPDLVMVIIDPLSAFASVNVADPSVAQIVGNILDKVAKELDCTFRSSFKGDGPDSYVGTIKKLGIDLGYTARGKIVWAVFAPTAGYHRGSLRGTYLGAAAEATLGAGVAANVLLGGTGGSIQLQPVSVGGQLGLNVAAAGTTVTLKAIN